MRSVSVPRAVSITIGTDERRRSARQTSRPSPSGSVRSSSTMSGSISSASSSARFAVAATCGSKPSRASALENGPEMLDSSSTNRTLGRGGTALMAIESSRAGRDRGTFCRALTRGWEDVGGPGSRLADMKITTKLIALLTVLVLGATAAVALASGGDTTAPAAQTTTNDDGTADQGRGDASPTPAATRSGDDEGTADQGRGDRPRNST